MNGRGSFGSALVLAAGIVVAGWFVGSGFLRGRTDDRYVVVKGLAEREVKADLALWPIRFVSTSDDLGLAQRRIEESRHAILAFLVENGIDSTSVELQELRVTDVLANPYRSGPVESRFIIAQTLMVRSEDPDVVREAGQQVGDLVDAGVVLSSEGGPSGGPTYYFTKLNDLKPAMIAEATANAREAAEQFARDSGSALGGIRKASQGVFVILPRDQAPNVFEESQPHKIVRVVSTVEYLLRD